ncbi:hypothetical protein COI97_15925 [Bacillus cereus]|nr:hypothetical protein COI97_15925 [Bacillus cereus]
MELYFNTDLCKESNITTALLTEFIRDNCELEGKKRLVISYEEFEEAFGIKTSSVENALRKVRDLGFVKYKWIKKNEEFDITLLKDPPKADNTMLRFPCKGQFSPKRMLIKTILKEYGGWMNSVEVGYASDGIFSKDAANAALNDMARKGELLKEDVTKESRGDGTCGRRIVFKLVEVTK